MARAVICDKCGASEDGIKAVTGEWRLYFQAIHALWDPREPIRIPGLTVRGVHLCPECSEQLDVFIGKKIETHKGQLWRHSQWWIRNGLVRWWDAKAAILRAMQPVLQRFRIYV